jgi:hypothetical protein
MGILYVAPTRFDKLSNTDYAATLEEVGASLGVTRERARQIEKKALSKLKRFHMTELLIMRELAITLRASSGAVSHGLSLNRDGRRPARRVIA